MLKGPLPHPEQWARALRVSTHDAEDLIQSAVLALIEKPEVQPRSPLGWLFVAARLGRRRLVRARARATAYEPQIEAHLRFLAGPFRQPDEEIDHRERLLAVLWLLDHVKPGRRAVAERHLFGSAEEEIAAELGLVLGTVKSRWRRAKQDMRGALDREMAKSGDKDWLAGLFALVAALWLWISRRVRRRSGLIMACAALAPVVAGHDKPAETSASDETASMLPSAFEVRFAPKLTAFAEREREAVRGGTGPEELVAPHHLLAQVSAALQAGHPAAAQTWLAQYKAAYRVDPTSGLARKRAALAAALATH